MLFLIILILVFVKLMFGFSCLILKVGGIWFVLRERIIFIIEVMVFVFFVWLRFGLMELMRSWFFGVFD